ncbi:hypothetical protein [Streptomyces sp. NBC_00009]|uniref:hypothetical protein n=1 Tax=Streptomyces sp. NBC_00009 TaxID=2975620 RepID=UPI003243B635
MTRAEWARTIADALSAPPQLVIPVPKDGTRYASRPENACLSSDLLPFMPCMRGIRIQGVQDGARSLAAAFRAAS